MGLRTVMDFVINTLNAELNPIFHLLVLLGAHHILHISRIRVKIKRGSQWRKRNNYCSGKVIIIIYSVCVFVVLGIQQAKRMRCIILASVDCPAVPYFFFTLPYKAQDFWVGKKLFHRKCVFTFYTNFLSKISHF